MKLKLIELQCPYDNWENEEVRNIYNELTTLKLDGFKNNYTDVLPIDTSDLISDHHIICISKNSKLNPVCAIKHTKFSTAKRFRLELQSTQMLKSLSSNGLALDQMNSINQIMQKIENFNHDTFYSGSMTISPEYRGRGEITQKIKDIIFSSLIWYKLQNKINIAIAIGLRHVKTDLMLERIGYQKAHFLNKELLHFKNPFFNNQEALLLYFENVSPYGKIIYDNNKHYYENRVIIGPEASNRKIAA